MLLQDSRRDARQGEAGELIVLAQQDRSRWDRARIAEGLAVLDRASALGPAGPYQLQAAIAAVHAQAESATDTDWPQIVALYDQLLAITPSPVIALNQAVAVAQSGDTETALRIVDALPQRASWATTTYSTRRVGSCSGGLADRPSRRPSLRERATWRRMTSSEPIWKCGELKWPGRCPLPLHSVRYITRRNAERIASYSSI